MLTRALPPDLPPLPPEAARELEGIYRDVDADVRALGVGCWIHGACCDFRRVDHRLFASSVEVAHVEELLDDPPAAATDSRLCPFWQSGRCTARERRPLGCRTYFCDRRYKDALEALYERYYRRLQELARRHHFPWQYVPFVEALRAGGSRSARIQKTSTADVERP